MTNLCHIQTKVEKQTDINIGLFILICFFIISPLDQCCLQLFSLGQLSSSYFFLKVYFILSVLLWGTKQTVSLSYSYIPISLLFVIYYSHFQRICDLLWSDTSVVQYMWRQKDSGGVELKLLRIQLIICSVSKSLMISQMCESKSKLQLSCRF